MYSIWDSECSRNVGNCINMDTEENCANAGVEFVSEDWDDKGAIKYLNVKLPVDEKVEKLKQYNFYVYEHSLPVGEFDAPANMSFNDITGRVDDSQ